MQNETIEKLLQLMSSTSSVKRHNIRQIYLARYGDQIVPYCIRWYQMASAADFRADLVWFVLKYARSDPAVFDFAVEALDDRSKKVRHSACAVLAYSLREDAIPFLHPLTSHSDPATAEDARRAIDAIECQNHNRFYPDHSSWGVPADDPLQPTKEHVDHFIVRQSPELTEPLREILGDVYG